MSIFGKNKKVDRLEKTVTRLNHRLQLMTETEATPRRRISGNTYRTYADGVEAIAEKYQGLAEWGCLHVGLIAEFRAGVISGKGLDLISEKSDDGTEYKNEMAYIREVLDQSGFFGDQLQTKTLFSELEGKLLYKLEWDPKHEWTNADGRADQGIVRLKFMQYRPRKYVVAFDADNPEQTGDITWTDKKAGPMSIKPDEYVFRATGAWLDDPNTAPPKLHRVLLVIDDLDKALRDWREIDKIFASPTPFFRLPDGTPPEIVDAMSAKIREQKWTIGGALVLPCDYSLVGADTAGPTILKEEILTRCRLVSGITGIPPHFIGLPDLMSNRATANSLGELISATTSREVAIWQSALKEIVKKSIRIRNTQKKVQLMAEDKIDVVIKSFTSDEIETLVNVWLPMWEKGALSNAFVLSKTPGINIEDELARQAEEQAEKDKDFPPLLTGNKKNNIIGNDQEV